MQRYDDEDNMDEMKTVKTGQDKEEETKREGRDCVTQEETGLGET